MLDHHKIDYVAFPSADFEKTKAFFATAFGWEFEGFGPDYTAFSSAGLNGGFFAADRASRTAKGARLIVFQSESLETRLAHFRACGARIVKLIFAFPGGRRFHFAELMGNEFAVWSEK